MVMTEDEKKLTAYHEAGHALVSIFMPKTDPLHKVTIIPRGRALGLTMSLPERDQLSQSERQLLSLLAVMFGGRLAEELIFGKENITTGAGNDIQQATSIARRTARTGVVITGTRNSDNKAAAPSMDAWARTMQSVSAKTSMPATTSWAIAA